MSGSTIPEGYAELCRLIQSLYNESITATERERLEKWLCGDKEARRIYAQYMNLFATLYWEKCRFPEMEEEADETPSKTEVQPPRSPVLGFLGDCFQQGASFVYRSTIFTLLVAVGLPVALFLAVMLTMIRESPPSPVAVIARSRDCAGRFDDRPTTFYPGSNLFEKQKLVIDRGLVEIQFADGASAVLEGPAAFEILGSNAGSLTRGRLAAVVPAEARGFAVETLSARVVDLGTEFGVWVDDDGRVETHVFGGQVEVTVPVSTDSPGPAARLGKGEAVQIAAADVAGESPKIVRIPAAAKQFTRSVALPEPTILFAHHGSADPTTEGWTLLYRQYGKGFPEKGTKLSAACPVGPIGEGGVAAWSFRPLKQDRLAGYTIRETKGLSPELQAEAREKGWVLRARVWISDQGPRPEQESEAPCIVIYRDDERTWSFRVLLDPHGNQYVKGMDSRVDPIPGSRNQYVDYELRYDPIRKHAEFFVNGRRVARHKGSPNRDTINEDYESYPVIRFGTCFVPTEVRFANFEWGILRDADKAQPKP